jgi:hypothetical protein
MSPVAAQPPRIRTGRAIASVLRGGWRATQADVDTDVSPRCVEQLLRSGCAALAWRPMRHTHWAERAALQPLRQAARIYALRAAVGSRQLAELAHALQSTGVDPLLFKGWAAARLYAEPALRPFGDVDVCVRPTHRNTALEVVRALAGDNRSYVDLHISLPDLPDRPLDEVLTRSRLVAVGGAEIRALCPEDHLRCLALHFFRHGATRPLSLCDIGAAMESSSSNFDWDYCLRGDAPLTNYVVVAMKLTSGLLGARLPASAPLMDATSLPRWLTRAVLRQWGSRSYDTYVNRPLMECLRSRGDVMPALRRRWPSAVQLTVDRHAPIGTYPPLWLQVGTVVSQALGFARRMRRPLSCARA